MHNPAALRSLMPCSHPQCCLCGKTIFWHHCVNIMVLRYSISQFAPSQSHPHPPMFLLTSYFLTVHISDFFSIRPLLPLYSTCFSFLPEYNSDFAFFSSSFSLKLSGLRTVGVVEGAVITPSQTLVQCIYTLTLSWCLKAAAALIETNGEITQAAVLNNSLHSHLSGSMLPQWEAGCWGGWDWWGCE